MPKKSLLKDKNQKAGLLPRYETLNLWEAYSCKVFQGVNLSVMERMLEESFRRYG